MIMSELTTLQLLAAGFTSYPIIKFVVFAIGEKLVKTIEEQTRPDIEDIE